MALIKCPECNKNISDKAETCPECGKIVKHTDAVCPDYGYPLQKKNAQSIINDNLDKITGARSKNYVTFKDLFKNTFAKHTEEELDEVFICGGEKTTPALKDVDPTKATAWSY